MTDTIRDSARRGAPETAGNQGVDKPAIRSAKHAVFIWLVAATCMAVMTVDACRTSPDTNLYALILVEGGLGLYILAGLLYRVLHERMRAEQRRAGRPA